MWGKPCNCPLPGLNLGPSVTVQVTIPPVAVNLGLGCKIYVCISHCDSKYPFCQVWLTMETWGCCITSWGKELAMLTILPTANCPILIEILSYTSPLLSTPCVFPLVGEFQCRYLQLRSCKGVELSQRRNLRQARGCEMLLNWLAGLADVFDNNVDMIHELNMFHELLAYWCKLTTTISSPNSCVFVFF